MIRPVCLSILLAGCSAVQTPANDQEACARQANDDPVVRELIVKGAGNPHFQMEGQDQLRAARQDATLACLRGRNLIPQGGVERQKPL